MGTKGTDYTVEHIIKQGRPFSQIVPIATGQTTGTILGTVRPETKDFVVYITEIAIKINVGTGTVWEIEIDSPAAAFFDASASDDGDELASLISSVKAELVTTNGITHTGQVKLKSLIPAYFNKKGVFGTSSVGKDGAWEVRVGANSTDDGTDNVAGFLHFIGSEVRKKSTS